MDSEWNSPDPFTAVEADPVSADAAAHTPCQRFDSCFTDNTVNATVGTETTALTSGEAWRGERLKESRKLLTPWTHPCMQRLRLHIRKSPALLSNKKLGIPR